MVNKDSMYPYIWAWGRHMGSYDYYMENQEEEAARDDAPRTAIFKSASGEWHTVDGVVNEELQAWLHDFVHQNFTADLKPGQPGVGALSNPEQLRDRLENDQPDEEFYRANNLLGYGDDDKDPDS